ncbi:hypothetical protein CPB83DRAFT_840241 [Crepidotus variabilis]|uniref:Uncharacterized protein n=1 Tax=Crepidotus variabilis TaxID=179855 RepID=A0A9P6JIZ5_9AGAR|nr:hypothetical protein CPB83DRAFT_840241 [Crepidotus variabilis]
MGSSAYVYRREHKTINWPESQSPRIPKPRLETDAIEKEAKDGFASWTSSTRFLAMSRPRHCDNVKNQVEESRCQGQNPRQGRYESDHRIEDQSAMPYLQRQGQNPGQGHYKLNHQRLTFNNVETKVENHDDIKDRPATPYLQRQGKDPGQRHYELDHQQLIFND